jgi:hypothetical protein
MKDKKTFQISLILVHCNGANFFEMTLTFSDIYGLLWSHRQKTVSSSKSLSLELELITCFGIVTYCIHSTPLHKQFSWGKLELSTRRCSKQCFRSGSGPSRPEQDLYPINSVADEDPVLADKRRIQIL